MSSSQLLASDGSVLSSDGRVTRSKTQGNLGGVVGNAENGILSKELHVGKGVVNDIRGSKGKAGKGTSKGTKSNSQSIDRDDNAVNGIKSQSCDTQKGKAEKGTSSSCRKLSSNVDIANDASPSSPRHSFGFSRSGA